MCYLCAALLGLLGTLALAGAWVLYLRRIFLRRVLLVRRTSTFVRRILLGLIRRVGLRLLVVSFRVVGHDLLLYMGTYVAHIYEIYAPFVTFSCRNAPSGGFGAERLRADELPVDFETFHNAARAFAALTIAPLRR